MKRPRLSTIFITTGTEILEEDYDIGGILSRCLIVCAKSVLISANSEGKNQRWVEVQLTKCPLSVAILFKIPYIKNVESGDSEEGDTA